MHHIILAACLFGASPAAAEEVYSVESGHEKGSGVALTRPDGTKLYVNPAAIAFVRKPLPGEQGNAVIVFASGAKQATLENVEQVIRELELDRPGDR